MDRNRNTSGELRNEGSLKVWRIIAVAASLLLYASVFVPLYRHLSQVTGALSMFPVALAGLLFGLRGGISIGVLLILLNFYLFNLVTPQGWAEFVASAPAHLAALLVGGLTGWLSELLHRVKAQARELALERKVLKDQIEERQQSEGELQKLHIELEQRVIERTAQLQSANDELQRSKERYHLLFEELRDREALLRSVLNNIPQFVFWKDRNFVYLGANNVFAAAAHVGSPDQIVGKTDFDFHWKESAEGFHAVDQSVMESDTADSNRVELQCMPNGEELWFETTKVPLHDAHGEVIGILGTSQNVTQRHEASEALEYRMRLEQLISGISTSFVNVASDHLDCAIHAALTAVGSFVNVDRCYVCSWPEHGANTIYEWCAEGIELNKENIRHLTDAEMKWWAKHLENFQTIHIPRIADLPQEALHEKNLLEAQHILSLIAVPLIYRGELVGFLGFDSIRGRKTWANEDVGLLKTVGEIIVNALQRKRDEEEILRAKQQLEMLVTSSTVMLYACEAFGDFDATFVSDNIHAITGYTKEEFLSKGFWASHIHPADAPNIFNNLAKLFEHDHHEHEYRFLFKEGTYNWMYDELKLIRDESGNPLVILGTWTDITERKRAEERLQASERRYRELFENNPQAMLVYDLETLAFLSVNDAMIARYGYSREEFLSMTIKDIRPEEDVPLLLDNIAQPEQRLEHAGEWRHKKKDGTIIDVEITSHSLPLWNGRPSRLVSASDVTERKRVEEALRESEKRYREVVENASDIIYSTDWNGRFTHANAAALRIVGYSLDELTKLSYLDLILPDYRSTVKTAYLQQFMAKQPSSYIEFPFLAGSGEVRWFSQNASLVLEGRRAVGFHVIARDITERKQVEERLRASLHEKEILLKEIHHRVKNNMQVISSLLSLQSHSVTDERFLRLLKESQNRVKSMAMIHERLYRSSDFSSINFTDYIRELVASLVRSYGVRGNITVTVSGEPVTLSIDAAVPCGLIINELMSNALKYAFPDGGTGEISIDLSTPSSTQLLLEVRDNGVGIADTIDPLNADSLGLRLVNILTSQVQGTLQLDRSNGTCFVFRIPI